MFGLCVCCCLIGSWVQDLWSWSNSITTVSWHADVGQKFCDGPFINLLEASNLTLVEQVLEGSRSSSDQVCLAMLFDLQGSFIQARRLATDVCVSYEADPVAKNVACGLSSFFSGKVQDCISYRQDAENIACNKYGPQSSVCKRASLNHALAGNLNAWDVAARRRLADINLTSPFQDIQFVSLAEMVDNEFSAGDASFAASILRDIFPKAFELAAKPLLNSRAVLVFRLYAELLSWDERHHEAAMWFSTALENSKHSWDRSMVFFEDAKMKLYWATSPSEVSAATDLTDLGTKMLADISADDKSIFWYQPLRNKIMIANRTGQPVEFDAKRLKDLLAAYPYLYTQREARLLLGSLGFPN